MKIIPYGLWLAALCFQSTVVTAWAAPKPTPYLVEVPVFRETKAVASREDAADDPALWADKASPKDSRIIGTDKKGGLYVYDLHGRQIQFVPAGQVNNVDIREGFPFPGGPAPIVVATDRDDQSLAVFRFDEKTRMLDPKQVAAIPAGLSKAYGLCLYHPPGGDFYAIATSRDGDVKQYRLKAEDGTVTGEAVREFALGSIAEGCVADDELGVLYIAQEDVALWRLSADPATGDARTPVAVPGPLMKMEASKIAELSPIANLGPQLTDDIEGVALYKKPNGKGYLVVSSQGNSRFVLFERGGKNAYVGTFIGVYDKGVDDISGTDGIEVGSGDFGPDYPGGIFVAQDDVNTHPLSSQNFKMVPWERIAKAIGLEE